MQNITKLISEYVYSIKYDNLPEEVVEQLKMFIADYFAASFAGYRINSKFNEAIKEVILGQEGTPECSVFMSDIMIPDANAAFLNGAFAHGADMDDGNKKAMGHMAAHIMSSVFAVAETRKVTWGKVMESVIAGYEVYIRIAGSAQPGIVNKGFHSTGVAGTIASAAACAKLIGLDSDGIYRAMSIASIQGSGLMIITESGQECKAFSAANSARVGVIAAKLAERGIKGPQEPLESRKGWYNAYSTECNDDILTEGLGKKFTICESYLKPYASCRHTHYGIECAKAIKRRMEHDENIACAKDIDRIELRIYPTAIKVSGAVTVPENINEAKFSIAYSLAVALYMGRFGLDELNPENVPDEVFDLIKKITIVSDENFENVSTGQRKCVTRVYLSNGTDYSEEVTTPKGDMDNPFTWEDMKEKMLECSRGVVPETKAMKIMEAIKRINPEDGFAYIIK